MKRLADLVRVLPDVRLIGPVDVPVRRIGYWSDEIEPGDMFVAIPGHQCTNAAGFAEAVARGARTILCRRPEGPTGDGVTYAIVPDPIRAMGLLAHALHDFPSCRLRVVGVTGTNGKTTIAALLHRLFRALGHKAGLLSNIGDWIDGEASAPVYTTGPAPYLAAMMARMVAAGCTHCFMEVSSQGIAEARLEGVAFAGGIFTNLTRDHLDYHGTMANYAAAKKSWFDRLPATAFAVANADDLRGGWMLADGPARPIRYGTSGACDVHFRIEAETLDGLCLDIDGRPIRSPLLGAFNASNLAAVYAAACALGERPDEVARALATLEAIEGRMQAIREPGGRTAIVDYAHTPDAVEKVLGHLLAVRGRGARTMTVIGCGGGGDVGRRPLIAAAAAASSDRLILTSDNPRDDDPAAILAHMATGLDAEGRSRTDIVPDRAQAIAAACGMARPGDVILIAGKGHEQYQEIAGVRHPFDDVRVARAALGLDQD